MKNLRNLMTAALLMVMLVLGTVSANAGIIIAGRTEPADTCTTKVDDVDWGIIIAGVVGIIIAGRDGIIIAGKGSAPCQQGKDGIIIAG